MQRAMSGDCVAWNPLMAPQAMEMNISGKIGCPGARFFMPPASQNSGSAGCFTKSIARMPTAMNSSAAAKRG